MTNANNHQYDDIIDLPHHVSATRPRMSMIDRAAQFSPFAALSGYGAAVKETARLTEEWLELSEDRKAVLNEKLQILAEQIDSRPEAVFTYFRPDEKKAGGAYVSVTGSIKKIDSTSREIILMDRTAIPIDQIYEIESELFQGILDA